MHNKCILYNIHIVMCCATEKTTGYKENILVVCLYVKITILLTNV